MNYGYEMVCIHAMDTVNITSAIVIFNYYIQNEGLNGMKLIGQGYDDSATMAKKINEVRTILRDKYPNALFFYCGSHKLNLVVNDLNCVPKMCNTISTIKDIISFYRESDLCRKYIPTIFCET